MISSGISAWYEATLVLSVTGVQHKTTPSRVCVSQDREGVRRARRFLPKTSVALQRFFRFVTRVRSVSTFYVLYWYVSGPLVRNILSEMTVLKKVKTFARIYVVWIFRLLSIFVKMIDCNLSEIMWYVIFVDLPQMKFSIDQI